MSPRSDRQVGVAVSTANQRRECPGDAHLTAVTLTRAQALSITGLVGRDRRSLQVQQHPDGASVLVCRADRVWTIAPTGASARTLPIRGETT